MANGENQEVLSHPIEIKKEKIQNLLLDDENPRFAGLTTGYNENDLIKKLSEEKNLGELIQSFKENGFYEAEPILVIKHKEKKGKYRVIEGNRRVAAIKTLLDKRLMEKFGYIKSVDEYELLGLIKEELTNQIPIQIYEKRETLWSYQGYRHLKGARPWDPYSKTLYITTLSEKYGQSLKEIAARIGDTNVTVYKMFNGMKVLKQAEDEGLIEPPKIQNFAFSHLYIILGYSETKKFLGIRQNKEGLLSDNPVPTEKIPSLKLLIEFIYGDKEGKKRPVVKSQNPDIRRLNSVFGDRKALNSLTENSQELRALENAFMSTGEEDYSFEKFVSKALETIKKASGNAHLYKGDEEILGDVEEISVIVKELIERMKKKIKPKKR